MKNIIYAAVDEWYCVCNAWEVAVCQNKIGTVWYFTSVMQSSMWVCRQATSYISEWKTVICCIMRMKDDLYADNATEADLRTERKRGGICIFWTSQSEIWVS